MSTGGSPGGSPVTRHMSAAASVSCNKPDDADCTTPASESSQPPQSVSSDADHVESSPHVSRRKQSHPCRLQSPASLKKVTKPALGKEKERQLPESGDVVWAKLGGYPWWPGLVHGHPLSGNHAKGKGKSQMVHVWFFSHPPSRSWIKESLVKPFDKTDGFYIGKRYIKTSFQCRMYAERAENALSVPREQRLELASPADAPETPNVAVTPQADALSFQDPEKPIAQTKPTAKDKASSTTTDNKSSKPNNSSKPRKRQPFSTGTKTASKKMKKTTTVKQELSVLKQESAMPDSPVMEGVEKAESSVSSQPGTFSTSDVVWAKVLGYPWWPGLVCLDPNTGTHLKNTVGKELKIHVAFFAETPTRVWVPHKFVKPFTDISGLECGGRFFATSARCRTFAKQAADAVKMSSKDRLSLVSVSGSTASTGKEGLFAAVGDSIPSDQNEAAASSGKGGKRKRSQPKSKSKPAFREPQNASRVETDNLSPKSNSSFQQSLIPSFFQSSPRSADSNSPDLCMPPGKEPTKTEKSKGQEPTKTGKLKQHKTKKPSLSKVPSSNKGVETSLSPQLKRKKTSPSLLPYTSPVMKSKLPSQLTQSPEAEQRWKQASPVATQSPLGSTHSANKTRTALGRLGTQSPAQGVIPGAMDPCQIEESRTVLATGEGIPLVNFNTDSPEGARGQFLGSPRAPSVTYEADAETEKGEASTKQTKKKRPTKIERMNKWMCGAKNVNRGRSKEDRAKLQYQLATRRNRLRYEHQIRTGEYDPQRREKEKKLKKMRFKSWRPKTKEEYQEMRKERALLRRQDRVNALEFLKTEQKMQQLLIDIRRSLSAKNKEEARCVELLNELQSLPMRPLLIIKNPEVVYSISRIFGYTDKTVREKAEGVYDKFMAMFGVPENQTFMDAFKDAVAKFQENNERERNRAVERSQGIGYSSSESDSDAYETADSGSEATNDDNEKETECEDAEDNGTDAGSLEELDTRLVRPEDEVSESNTTDLSMDESEEPIPPRDSTQQVNLVPGLNGGSLNKYCDSFGSVEQLFDRVAQVLQSSGPDGDLEQLVTDQNLDNSQGAAGEPSTSSDVETGASISNVAKEIPSSSLATKKTRKSSKKQSKPKTAAASKRKREEALKVDKQEDAKDTKAKRKRGPIKSKVSKKMKPVQQVREVQSSADEAEKQDQDIEPSTDKPAPSAKLKLKRKSARKWKPPSVGATAQVLGTLTVVEETTASDKDQEKTQEKQGPDAEAECDAQNSKEEVGTLPKRARKKPRKKVFKAGLLDAKEKSGKEISVSGSNASLTMTRDMMEELEELLEESQAVVSECMLVIMGEHLREIETPNQDLEAGTDSDGSRGVEIAGGKELEAINQRLQNSTQRLLVFEQRMQNGDVIAGSTDETEKTTADNSQREIKDDEAEKSPACSQELQTALPLPEKSASGKKAKKAQKGHKKTAANKKKYVPPQIEISPADAATKEKTSCEANASHRSSKTTFSAPQKKMDKDEENAPEKESCTQQKRKDNVSQEGQSALSPKLTRRRKKLDEDQLDSSPEMMRSKPNLISSVFKSFSQAVRGGLGLSPEDKRRGRRKFTTSPRVKDDSASGPKVEKQESDKDPDCSNAKRVESKVTEDAAQLETPDQSTSSQLHTMATDSNSNTLPKPSTDTLQHHSEAVETTTGKVSSSPAPVASELSALNDKSATEPDSPGFDFSQSSVESEPDPQEEMSKGPFEEEDIFKTVPFLKECAQGQQKSSVRRSPRLLGTLQAVANNLPSEETNDAKTEAADLNFRQSPRLHSGLSAPSSPPLSPEISAAETNKVASVSLPAEKDAVEEPSLKHSESDSNHSNHSPRRSPRFAGTPDEAVATKDLPSTEALQAEGEEHSVTARKEPQTTNKPEEFSPRHSPRVRKPL